MDARKLARTYHAAVDKLAVAEAAHGAATDRLDDARTNKRAAEITTRRKEAEASELVLSQALQAADQAHRDYWQARRAAMLGEAAAAVGVLHRFKHVAQAAGQRIYDPIPALLVEHSDQVKAADVIEDVPVEAPDSEMLENFRGCWR